MCFRLIQHLLMCNICLQYTAVVLFAMIYDSISSKSTFSWLEDKYVIVLSYITSFTQKKLNKNEQQSINWQQYQTSYSVFVSH